MAFDIISIILSRVCLAYLFVSLFSLLYIFVFTVRVMCGSRGRGRMSGPSTPPHPPRKSQKYRVFSKTGLDPLKKHKATKPALNVGPLSPRQQNAVQMAFRWRADDGPLTDDGPLIVAFRSSLPSSIEKIKKVKFGPL